METQALHRYLLKLKQQAMEDKKIIEQAHEIELEKEKLFEEGEEELRQKKDQQVKMIKEQMREVKAEEPLKMKKITQWESSYP